MDLQTEIPETTRSMDDYSALLDTYGLAYRHAGYYWQVGNIERTEGWILHISVIKLQLEPLLAIIIPELMADRVPFKIASDSGTADSLLDGSIGSRNLGKLVSIYPENDQQALALGKRLIGLTKDFRGPTIPTDRKLGGVVYTRYGSFQPIMMADIQGHPIQCIYNSRKELIADPYHIPFILPEGQDWPFGELADAALAPAGKLLNSKYYPIRVIKPDVKGRVLKALYFKNPLYIRACLIKEGIKCMFVDEQGRDIQDRLQWQVELHTQLAGIIPLPGIIDFFMEQDNRYLVMEFVKGDNLVNWVYEVYNNTAWTALALNGRIKLMDRLLEIFSLIQKLHEQGFIHRDINPGNFLIDRKGRLFLIDLELAWSAKTARPDPPFGLGTAGFISPEQAVTNRTPTEKEDVYALGSLMWVFFTNLPPVKLEGCRQVELAANINFFVGDEHIAALMAACWEHDPSARPSLQEMIDTLKAFRNELTSATKNNRSSYSPSSEILKNIIQSGINGLSNPDMLGPNSLWFSRIQQKEGLIGNPQKEMAIYPGWHTGLAGPLWLLGTAKGLGFNIDACLPMYENAWQYIEGHYFADPARSSGGLFTGGAGIARALTAGLKGGLIPFNDEIRRRLLLCFVNQLSKMDLSEGLAGQSIALLHAIDWLDRAQTETRLKANVDFLLQQQQADGSWDIPGLAQKKDDTVLGLGSGVAGIAWFFLAYLKEHPDPLVEKATTKAIAWLLSKARPKNSIYDWSRSTQAKSFRSWSIVNGTPGIILLLIRAYKIVRDPRYREVAEDWLATIPAHLVITDFGQGSGLAGIGELYLEAAQAFANTIWQERADWLAGLFIHGFKQLDDTSGYWAVDDSNIVTADLFQGNGAVLHFLLRMVNPENLDHPLA